MDSIRAMQCGSRAIRNFNSEKAGCGAKLRLQVIQQIMLNAATEKRLSKRNQDERKDHEDGTIPLILVPTKSGTPPCTHYYVWDRKFCAPSTNPGGGDNLLEALRKELVKQEFDSLVRIESSSKGESSVKKCPKLKKFLKEEKTRIQVNWNYAFKIAIEWFYQHCRGGPVPELGKIASSDEKKKSTNDSKTKKNYKVQDPITFIHKCLLPLEENKLKTQTLNGQVEGENFIIVTGIYYVCVL